MRIPRVKFSVRMMILAIAIAAASANFVVVPVWRYYQLSPQTRRVLDKLEMTMPLPGGGASALDLNGFLKQIRATSVTGSKDIGIPIYLDPTGLEQSGSTITAPIEPTMEWKTIKKHLDRNLPPLGLDYFIKDGMLTITSAKLVQSTLASQPDSARKP